jgi:hypothetical protein
MPHRGPREHDELFFQDALDANPGDSALRRLFAEWLAGRGDWRASGYLWMARRHKAPSQDLTPRLTAQTWEWWSMLPGWEGQTGDVNTRPDRLPTKLLRALDGYAYKSGWTNRCAYCQFYTRIEAEESLCRAVTSNNSMST